MFSQLRKTRHNSTARRSRSRRARVTQFEVMEERVLMSAIKPRRDETGAGHSIQTAAPLSEMPLQPLKISSSFLPGKPIDAWKEKVNAGDDLAVSVEETNGVRDLLKIKILGPNGRVVDQTRFSQSPSLFVEAKTTGTYTIQVIDRSPRAKARDTVTIEVFGINKGNPLPSALVDSGKRVAWLNGNVLSLADPSGEGFAITSNWNTSVETDPRTGLQYTIYTTAGPSTIKLGASTNNPDEQGVAITLNGPITVRTNPGPWGSHAGTVASAVFGSSASPGVTPQTIKAKSITPAATTSSVPTSVDPSALFTQFNEKFGLGITVPGTGFGMDTGKTLMAKASFSGIPLRPNATYFYYQKNTGGSVSFGGVTASAGGSTTVTVIVDPSDPFVFVAAGPIEFGASLKGLIPFVPASSSYHGATFSGHFYGAVKDVPLGNLPASVSGMAVINVDPNSSGSSSFLSLGSSTADLFSQGTVQADVISNLIDIGVNGTVTATSQIGGVDLSVDVAHATAAFVAKGTDPALVLKPANQIPAGSVIGVVPGTSGVQNLSYASLRPYLPATLAPDQPNGFVNSALSANPKAPIPFLGVPVDAFYTAGRASRPASFAISGNTEDPFAGTALEGYFKAGPHFVASMQSSGNTNAELLQNLTADFHGSADWGTFHFGEIDFEGNKDRVSFNAPMRVFLGTAQVSGDVNFHTGAFATSLTFGGTNAASFLPGSTNVTSRSLTVGFKNTPSANGAPNLSLYANVSLGFRYSQDFTSPAVYWNGWLIFPAIDFGSYGVYGTITGKINIDPSNSIYTGKLSATGGIIVASQNVGGTVSVGFENRTISVGANIDVGFLGNYWVGFSLSL